jgi:V/A-type H+-transporting ATPase subunit I
MELAAEGKELQAQRAHLQAELNKLRPWGNFNPATIAALRARNLDVVLGRCPTGRLPDVPATAILHRTATLDRQDYFVVVAQPGTVLNFTPLPMPQAGSTRQLRQKLADCEQAMADRQNRLAAWSACRDVLRDERQRVEAHMARCEARDGMGRKGRLSYLQGYIPASHVDRLREAARHHGWALQLSDPPRGDGQVPTLIRLPRWVEPIRLVFKSLGVIPGYHEIDISAWFLIFFSLFFAILIGDAGYGALFLIATLVLRKKFPQAPAQPFWLFGELAICTILWGVLSGTYFGWTGGGTNIALLADLADKASVQKFCFLLGAVHLSIAHLWNALLIGRRVRAISELGWMLIFCGNFFLAGRLVLGQEVAPNLMWWLYGPGAAAVVLFSRPSFNPVKAIAGGLGSLAMNIIGSFVDLVSYIRLFAVGAASVAVAQSFNSMAFGMQMSPVLKGLAVAVILLLGHGLNIILCAMSVLVHGIRLNMLEFSGHLGMEWSGVAYRPLTEPLPPEQS